MEYVRLGTTGLKVSRLCLGAMTYGTPEWRPWVLDEAASVPFIRRALEHGINFFDTADMYSRGVSEQVLGRALNALTRRDQVVIATKAFYPVTEGPNQRGLSRKHLLHAIDDSLQRLGTDYVDLYQIHRFDFGTPIEETLGALHELVQEGSVRWIGSSNFSAQQIEEADRVARERGLTRFVSAQNHYSFVHREIEDEVLPACERLGIGQLPYFPLASGLLTGKYVRGEEATEGRLAGREIPDEQWERVEALQRFADEHGISLLEVAIGGLLGISPAVSSVIAGATKPEQVRANVQAGVWEPSPEDVAALKALR
jgi:aryl-alcohol dehydrogenase (NADP+)